MAGFEGATPYLATSVTCSDQRTTADRRSIRQVQDEDLPAIISLYDAAHEVMRESGNATQWEQGYPGLSDIAKDRQNNALNVCANNEEVQAVFCLAPGPDPTYAAIDGAWLNDEPYVVIHRIASLKGSGTGRYCIAWACNEYDNVRIDTHENNAPMRHVLESLGFVECGVIICDKGTPRIAYQHVRHQADGT